MSSTNLMRELSEPSLPVLDTPADQDAGSSAVRAVWPEAAFERVFRQQYAHIASLLTRLVGDLAQAEEITGEAFWRLYHRPALAAPGNNVAGWLYRTAMRLGLDQLRHRKRRLAGEEHIRVEPLQHGGEADPLTGLESRERAALVRLALSRLKPAQAQLLLLRHNGASYLELAATLDVKPSSVGTTLARAEVAFARQWHRLQHELGETK